MIKPVGTAEADIVCFGSMGARRPHLYVLARITRDEGRAHRLEPTPGVQWSTTETTGGRSLELTCPRHGPAQVDLLRLDHDMRAAQGRLQVRVLDYAQRRVR